MKQRLPLAAAFWLPPLIVPVVIGALLSPHLLSEARIVLLVMLASLLFTYVCAAALGIPAFRYFRSKESPKASWATAFGLIAGALTMLMALVFVVSAPPGSLSEEPRAAQLFSFDALALLVLGAVLGAAIAALSWRMLKAYPPLQRFR